jgi:NADH-quinone oxidoreductase subunit D
MNALEPEILKVPITPLQIGPFDPMLFGAIRLQLEMDGEVIARSVLETGWTCRSIDKRIQQSPWVSLLPYMDKIDPENAVFAELVACLAIEELLQVEVSDRASAIRVILSELTRIASHLKYIVKIGQAVGSEAIFHYALRDREKILDLLELLTGARFSLHFLRIGGVREDVTEGFIERILETCEMIKSRIKEYNDVLTFNQVFLGRTAYLGVLSEEFALKVGVTGPNARASGVRIDLRRDEPYALYGKLDFYSPLGSGEFGITGDCHDRFLIRLREIEQSVEIIRQIAELTPSGAHLNSEAARIFHQGVSAGTSTQRVESPRGIIECQIESEGGPFPSRFSYFAPSNAHLQCVPELLEGCRLEDLPVVLASLDYSISEVDR